MGTKTRPTVWFFYECIDDQWGDPKERLARLEKLLSLRFGEAPSLAHYMANKGYGIVIACRWLDSPTVNVIKKLNAAGTPVKLWLVVDDGFGYWTNYKSWNTSKQTYYHFLRIIESRSLKVDGIGFDLEYPIQVAQQFSSDWKNWQAHLRFIRALIPAMISGWQKAQGMQKELDNLVHHSAIPIEFYAFQRIPHFFLGGGLYPTKGSRVISMDYASYAAPGKRYSLMKALRKASFPHSISALGILGTYNNVTPGRLFADGVPPHLDCQGLVDCLKALKDSNNGSLPQELYVFALDSVNSIGVYENALHALWD